MRVNGDTLRMLLEEAGKNPDDVTEADLLALGATPVKAWRIGDLFVVQTREDEVADVAF